MAKRPARRPLKTRPSRPPGAGGGRARAKTACSVARGLPIETAGFEGCGAGHPPVFDHECPLDVRVLSYPRVPMPLPPVRHDFLEILVGLDGEGRLAVGERLVEFAAGDVLAVDANQTHRVIAFWGWRRRLLHVRFLPDLVYNLGSPMCDYVFLAPFYFQSPAVNPVLPGRHPRSAAVHAALRRLVLCVAAGATDSRAKAGSKAFLLEVIYLLAEHLHSGSAADTALARQSQRASRLSRLIDYINASFSERITVNDAAALVGMSRTPFMKLFRRATGSTFVSYLNQARLKEGRRLLSETDLSIAQVAASVGFSDQSYFDRRFRLRFGEAPRDYRRRVGADPGASDGAERISVSSGGPATVAGSGRRGRRGPR